MSLVENLINQISTKGLGGMTSPQGFDLDDDTFSKLLDKSMANTPQISNMSNFIGEMGMPAGLIIEPFDGIEFANEVQDQMEALGEKRLANEPISTEPIEMKDIDMGDYFSTLLKAGNDNNSDFMNFAKKHASNAYNVFSRTFVADMQDFAEDIAAAI